MPALAETRDWCASFTMIDGGMAKARAVAANGGFLTMSERGLRAFLTAANEGEAECVAEYPEFVEFIDKIDSIVRNFLLVEMKGDPLAGTLFMNAHASFLAACRIALSGQSPPTFMALRGALESALYALIASQTKENGSVWVNRRNNRLRARKLYTAGNGIQLLSCDPNLYAMAREAHELTIEFGAHPNVKSVAEHVRLDDEEPRLSLVYLHAAPSTAAARAIVACIETALVILFICPHTFPGHAAAMTVHSEASKLRKELDRYLDQHGYLRGEGSLDDQ